MSEPRYIDANKIKLLDSLSWKDENGDLLVSLRDVRNAIAQTPTEEVVALPCKVGDTLYLVTRMKEIKETKVFEVIYHAGGDTDIYVRLGELCLKFWYGCDWGKKLFPTREEAEKALTERCTNEHIFLS